MRFSRVLVLVVLCAMLGGCAVKPKPLSNGERASFASDIHARAYSQQEPINGSLTLYEAMARALKYNLDLKAELFEEALKAREYDTERAELLPSLISNVSARDRNNDPGGTAINVPTGNRTGGSNTSGARANQLTADLELSWDILDFGLSYVRAKQASDQILIAEERKRKVAARLLEDVRSSYWRAVGAEHLASGLKDISSDVETSLRRARQLENSGETSPIEALTYQRELIDIKTRIQDLEDQSSVAKIQLSALMNMPPGVSYKLNHTAIKSSSLQVSAADRDLVSLALRNRSEVAEVAYELRSKELDAQKALLEVLPSAKAVIGANFDANNLLLHQSWVPWGATVSANLMNVFKLPAKQAAVKAGEKRLDQKALALTVAIVTQVHVSKARFAHAKRRFVTASDHQKVQQKILAQVKDEVEAGTLSEQQLIREKMNTLTSKVRMDIAYAQMQNTFANVHAAVGIDPLTQGIDNRSSVAEIASQIEDFWRARGDLSVVVKLDKHKKVVGNITGEKTKFEAGKDTASSTQSKANKPFDAVFGIFKKKPKEKPAKQTAAIAPPKPAVKEQVLASAAPVQVTSLLAGAESIDDKAITTGAVIAPEQNNQQEHNNQVVSLPRFAAIPASRPKVTPKALAVVKEPVVPALPTSAELAKKRQKADGSKKILDAHQNTIEMVDPRELATRRLVRPSNDDKIDSKLLDTPTLQTSPNSVKNFFKQVNKNNQTLALEVGELKLKF